MIGVLYIVFFYNYQGRPRQGVHFPHEFAAAATLKKARSG